MYKTNPNLNLEFRGPEELISKKSLEQKEQDYFDLLCKINISPEGLLIYDTDVNFEPTDPNDPNYKDKYPYFMKGDSPFMGGLNLAMLGYRYNKTADKETLNTILKCLNGYMMLGKSTGIPGLWVRDIVPKQTFRPVNPLIETWIKSPKYDNYYIRLDVSRDQYHGILFGLGVLYKTVYDPRVRSICCELIEECADFLIANDYRIIDLNGSPTKHNMMFSWYGPFPVRTGAAALAIIKLAMCMTMKRKYIDEYNRLCSFPMMYDFAATRGFYDLMWFNKVNCNNQNMSMMSLYVLASYETDPKLKSKYIEAIYRQSLFTDKFTNPFWMFMQMETANLDNKEDRIYDCKKMLELFPDSKIRIAYDHTNRTDIKTTYFNNRFNIPTAKTALPSNFILSGFLWTNDTRVLINQPESTIRYSPIDFLLAYWLGKYNKYI